MLVWILLLVLSLSLLSFLLTVFTSNSQGESISSQSWSGYLVSKVTASNVEVTAINASWVVPSVNVAQNNSFSSVWIGIGGQLDSTLIQAGTEQDVYNGQATYYAWYELLPNYAVRIDTISLSPGDPVVVTISLVNSATNQWSIQVLDAATGQNFGITVAYNSTRSSGEWIIERPTTGDVISNLADFGNVSFSGCAITVGQSCGTISNFPFSKIEMTTDLNSQLTDVSRLTDNGTSFFVSYNGP